MSPKCAGCGDETDRMIGKGSTRVAACSANCYGLWMERNRILPFITFEIPLPRPRSPRELDYVDEDVVERLAEVIDENLRSIVGEGGQITKEQIVKATKMAIYGITINGTVEL